jgi:hypothetical protein
MQPYKNTCEGGDLRSREPRSGDHTYYCIHAANIIYDHLIVIINIQISRITTFYLEYSPQSKEVVSQMMLPWTYVPVCMHVDVQKGTFWFV